MAQMIGYARVSTRDQRIFAQIDQLSAAGCEKIFRDQGSGRNSRDRTDLGGLLEYVREGDVVVVTQLDRLSRSLMDLLQLLGNQGVRVRSLKEGFDTTTSDGRLVFDLMGVLAIQSRRGEHAGDRANVQRLGGNDQSVIEAPE